MSRYLARVRYRDTVRSWRARCEVVGSAEDASGLEGVRQSVAGYLGAFPDLSIRVEAQIAEGDLVTTRWTAVGTNSGEFWGQAPTGKQATVTGITIDQIAEGRIVESWTNWDSLGLM